MIARRPSLPQSHLEIQEEQQVAQEKPASSSLVALDIDKGNDAQFVPSLAQDLYAYFRSREASTSVRPSYMEDQQHITEHLRMILVDWLVEVHHKFDLVAETLYLAVNILDRFLAKAQVTRPKLQLVGITALLIASKYEEIWPATLANCIYVCDKAYDEKDFMSMEEGILTALEHRITVPTAHAFLLRFLMASEGDTQTIRLSYYILDGTLQSYYLLHFLPSQLAAAAVFVARKVTGREPWTPTLVKYTEYREEEVLPVARAVVAVKTYCSAGLHKVNAKYASAKYGEVSKIKLPTEF